MKKNNIEVNTSGVQIVNHKCLPDEADKFNEMFINSEEMMVKNHNLLQRSILGLTSYFKSAQESLLPSFIETPSGENFHIVSCEMSDYQFTLYETDSRQIETELSTKYSAWTVILNILIT